MKKILATALTLALASATSAAIAETIKYSTKDSYAYASWYASDDCSYSSLNVSASEAATRQTGSGPVTSSYVGVFYSSSNWCTGEYDYGYGYAQGAGDVNVEPKATRVQATLESYDYMSGEIKEIVVDLAFTGNGEYASRGMSNYMSTDGPIRTRSRSVGSSESANVAGTVTVNGVDLIQNSASAWASIGKSSSGSIEVMTPDA